MPALREFAKSVTPEILSGLGEGGPGVLALKVGLVMILAPVSENSFSAVGCGKPAPARPRSLQRSLVLTATAVVVAAWDRLTGTHFVFNSGGCDFFVRAVSWGKCACVFAGAYDEQRDGGFAASHRGVAGPGSGSRCLNVQLPLLADHGRAELAVRSLLIN